MPNSVETNTMYFPKQNGSNSCSLANAVFLATYCFLILYSSITSFDTPTPWYHAQVSYQIILAASVLALPFLIFPSWQLERLLGNPKQWMVFCLCLGLATVFSLDPVVSVPRLRLIYSVILFGLLVKAWLSRSSQSALPLMFLALAFVHAAILILVIFAYTQVEDHLGDYSTWLPYHSHIRHLGYHGVVAAAAGLAFSVLVPRLRLVGLFFSAFALFGLIFFGSRGALLTWGLFVGLAVALCRNRKYIIMAAAASILIAWLAATWAGNLKSHHIGTVADRSISTVSVSSRLHLWTDTVTAIKKRPLLGYGPEGYQASNCCSPGHIQAHNAVLQIVIEFGSIGLLAVLWLAKVTLGDEIVRLYRQKKSGDAIIPGRALVASMIVSLLAYSMVDGIVYHVIPLLILSILCALLFSIRDGGDALSERAS